MKDDTSLDPLFKQISALLELAKAKSADSLEGNVEPEFLEKLKIVEMMVNDFSDIVQKDLDKNGVTDEFLANRMFRDKENLPPRYRKDLDRATSLGREAMALKFALTVAQYQKWEKLQGATDKRDKDKKAKAEEIKKRKGKFKKMQGDQKWKKL